MRATVRPQNATPLRVDTNHHQPAPIQYVVAGCDLRGVDFRVKVEGLDSPNAATGSFEGAGDGVGFLHLNLKKGELSAGSSTIAVVVEGRRVHTSVLTVTLDRQSSQGWTWFIWASGVIGGLALFGLRNLGSDESWWKVWKWQVFQPAAGLLIVIAGVGAALGVLKTNYPPDWAFPDDAFDLFLKVGTATIAAATAIGVGKTIKDKAKSA